MIYEYTHTHSNIFHARDLLCNYHHQALPKAQDKRKLSIKTKLHLLFCFCSEFQWPSHEKLLKKMDKPSNNQANRSKLIVQRLNTFWRNHKLYVHFCTNRSQVYHALLPQIQKPVSNYQNTLFHKKKKQVQHVIRLNLKWNIIQWQLKGKQQNL